MNLSYLTSRRHYSSAQTIHPPVITFFSIHSFVLLPEPAGGGGDDTSVLTRAEHSTATYPQNFSSHLHQSKRDRACKASVIRPLVTPLPLKRTFLIFQKHYITSTRGRRIEGGFFCLQNQNKRDNSISYNIMQLLQPNYQYQVSMATCVTLDIPSPHL